MAPRFALDWMQNRSLTYLLSYRITKASFSELLILDSKIKCDIQLHKVQMRSGFSRPLIRLPRLALIPSKLKSSLISTIIEPRSRHSSCDPTPDQPPSLKMKLEDIYTPNNTSRAMQITWYVPWVAPAEGPTWLQPLHLAPWRST